MPTLSASKKRCSGWSICLAVASTLMMPCAPAFSAKLDQWQGIIPQGFWRLNEARSQPLNPGQQTLWVVKDNGKDLVFMAVVRSHAGETQVMSFNGIYGGPPTPFVGSPLTTTIVPTGASALKNYGTVAGGGVYEENCIISNSRRRFRCEGSITLAGKTRVYVDDFDWEGPSPPSLRQ